MYARHFFDLQLEFAERVSAVSTLPFARTVLDYTNVYIRFGFGRDFDPANAGWQEYLGGPLWGQFVSRWGAVRENTARECLGAVLTS